MRKSILYKGIFCSALLLTVTFSCKKSLDQTNPNEVVPGEYFNTSAQIVSATNGIYSVLHSQSLVGREWFFLHDLRADEVAAGGGQLEAPRKQVLDGVADAANDIVGHVWVGLYALIHRANTVIENAPKVPQSDNPALVARCVGEAKFLRAWAYYELVTMWGSVPVYTTTVKLPSELQPRAKVEDIYALIEKDLEEAQAALPSKSGYGTADLGRATKAAANALLGRAYIQKGDYGKAKEALLRIPTTGADGYSLTDRYLDNFEEETEFNRESLFEVVFIDKGDNNFNWGAALNSVGNGASNPQSTVRNQEYNPIAWRNLIPSDKYLNEFEMTEKGAVKTDPRYSYSVYETGDKYNNGASTLADADQNGYSSTVNGQTKKVGWRKFMIIYKEDKSKASFHPAGNNQRLIRYAEVLLMLAECEMEFGNLPQAVTYLNQVRSRGDVQMPGYPTANFPVSSKAEVFKALSHEKMVELGGEEIRNVDIVRWRSKGYFATDPLSYFRQNRDELLPIPLTEIDNNPKLGEGSSAQNPGY